MPEDIQYRQTPPPEEIRKVFCSCTNNRVPRARRLGLSREIAFANWFCKNSGGALTLQRQNAENLKQILPEKEYRGLSPNYIPTMGLPVLLEEIYSLILEKYKSLKDAWIWKLGLRPRFPRKGIYKRNAVAVMAQHRCCLRRVTPPRVSGRDSNPGPAS